MQDNRYKDFWKFLKLLSDNDLLEHVVVIGSWAEYVYAQGRILKGFEANLRTLDIDFLVRNLRKPTIPVSLTALAKQAGYTVDQDVLNGTTKFYTPDLMEIEFLILQKGSGEKAVIPTNLGVNAQLLRHVSLLKEQIITVEMLGMKIIVPEPEAYVLHKMIINAQRGTKMNKDRESIERMIPCINRDRLDELYALLNKKERRQVDAFMKNI